MREIVVIALAEMGGAEAVVDTEDVAVKAFELAPSSFSWRKHPDQINLDGVRVALTDAAKPRLGGYVDGSVKVGWSLTRAGTAWAERNRPRVLESLSIDAPRRRDDARLETRKAALEKARVQQLDAFSTWSTQGVPTYRQAGEVFRVDDYTDPRTRRLKVQRVLSMLEADPSLGLFVREMADIALSEEGQPS